VSHPLPFAFAQGSVIGREHREAGRNNQDASHVVCSPDGQFLVVVVADGCGSGTRTEFVPQNEIGAQLGVRVFAQAVFRHLFDEWILTPGKHLLRFVKSIRSFLSQLCVLARQVRVSARLLWEDLALNCYLLFFEFEGEYSQKRAIFPLFFFPFVHENKYRLFFS